MQRYLGAEQLIAQCVDPGFVATFQDQYRVDAGTLGNLPMQLFILLPGNQQPGPGKGVHGQRASDGFAQFVGIESAGDLDLNVHIDRVTWRVG